MTGSLTDPVLKTMQITSISKIRPCIYAEDEETLQVMSSSLSFNVGGRRLSSISDGRHDGSSPFSWSS
ncbi:hypothetical protein F3Y22_tig00110954pilonHSYRG00117 [Hibiscus syriacus]|uniref:Uncharacterized protein n=1 Tax=Hibiscus syriacus TaxID=106335 RepID=A0A6A2ZB97_HIBSY|nr:hypothetical protein F3Y22_tig00110954pilonHSYRG00117 [Hibiscus syriacus]